jgi:UDPglucose--hexose-1-phosphate uridylyltransferase
MIYKSIQELINYAIAKQLIIPYDEFVVRNQLIDILKLSDWEDVDVCENNKGIDSILAEIADYACENHIIDDTVASRDLFEMRIMGVLTPYPREVVYKFNQYYAESPVIATNWYYDFSKNVNYVRAERIAKDKKWKYESEYGLLDITINLSKPEKDPKDIAAAKAKASTSYPKCQLCPENAGFAGHLNHPARQNLRPVPILVNNEEWQFQYSPYGYYNEHCIVFNEKHIPMKIDASVFEKLFDIIEYLPHYFVGSNADLPIVGGSILSHEHFQGGNYTFAMEKAPIEKHFIMEEFNNVQAGILKWPMSVIRLQSTDRHILSKACAHILDKWRNYSDPLVSVYAKTDDTPHNTITPIARINGRNYECDLVLRNNLTTKDRPLGLFHPNPSLHHIKKENIGLIEVMGLAVLPSRLAVELEVLKDAMLSGKDLDSDARTAQHAEWAREILRSYPEFSSENAKEIIHKEVGKVFEQVLLDAGVFKRNQEGKEAFLRFVNVVSKGE